MVSIIIDNDITLRSFATDDAEALFNKVNESRFHLSPWLDWINNTTKVEHSLKYIQDSLYELEMQEALHLGVFLNNKIIGGIGMHNWDKKTKRAQIGYWIGKEYEGKGIIYKCLIRFIDFLFDKIGLNKIEIHFVPGNIRSVRVSERLGFKIEGIIRQSLQRNGFIEDHVITGLLKSEWQTIKHTIN